MISFRRFASATALALALAGVATTGGSCGDSDPPLSASVLYLAQSDRDALAENGLQLRVGPTDATDLEIFVALSEDMPADLAAVVAGLPEGVTLEPLQATRVVDLDGSDAVVLRAKLRTEGLTAGAYAFTITPTAAGTALSPPVEATLLVEPVSFARVRVAVAHHEARGVPAQRQPLAPAESAALGYRLSALQGTQLDLQLGLRNATGAALTHLRVELDVPDGSGLRVTSLPDYDAAEDWRIVGGTDQVVTALAPSHHVGGGVTRDLALGLDATEATVGVHRLIVRARFLHEGKERVVAQLLPLAVHALATETSAADVAAVNVSAAHATGGELRFAVARPLATPSIAGPADVVALLSQVQAGSGEVLGATEVAGSLAGPESPSARALWAQAILADAGPQVGGRLLAAMNRTLAEHAVHAAGASPLLEIDAGRVMTDLALVASADAVDWLGHAPPALGDALVGGAALRLTGFTPAPFRVPAFDRSGDESDEAHFARLFPGSAVTIEATTADMVTVDVSALRGREAVAEGAPVGGVLLLASEQQVRVIEAASTTDRITVPIGALCSGIWRAAFLVSGVTDGASAPAEIAITGAEACDLSQAELTVAAPPFEGGDPEDGVTAIYRFHHATAALDRTSQSFRRLAVGARAEIGDEHGVRRITWERGRQFRYDPETDQTIVRAELEVSIAAKYRLEATVERPGNEPLVREGERVEIAPGSPGTVELTLPGKIEEVDKLELRVKRNPVAAIVEGIGLAIGLYDIGSFVYEKIANEQEDSPAVAIEWEQEQPFEIDVGGGLPVIFSLRFSPGADYHEEERFFLHWQDGKFQPSIGYIPSSYDYAYGVFDVRVNGKSVGGPRRAPDSGQPAFCSGTYAFQMYDAGNEQGYQELTGHELGSYDEWFPSGDEHKHFFAKGEKEDYQTPQQHLYVFALDWECRGHNRIAIDVDVHLCDAAYEDEPGAYKDVFGQAEYWVHYLLLKERRHEVFRRDITVRNPYFLGSIVTKDHDHHVPGTYPNTANLQANPKSPDKQITEQIEYRARLKLGATHHPHPLPPEIDSSFPNCKNEFDDGAQYRSGFLVNAATSQAKDYAFQLPLQHAAVEAPDHHPPSVPVEGEVTLRVTGELPHAFIDDEHEGAVVVGMKQANGGNLCWSAPIHNPSGCGTFPFNFLDLDPGPHDDVPATGGECHKQLDESCEDHCPTDEHCDESCEECVPNDSPPQNAECAFGPQAVTICDTQKLIDTPMGTMAATATIAFTAPSGSIGDAAIELELLNAAAPGAIIAVDVYVAEAGGVCGAPVTTATWEPGSSASFGVLYLPFDPGVTYAIVLHLDPALAPSGFAAIDTYVSCG